MKSQMFAVVALSLVMSIQAGAEEKQGNEQGKAKKGEPAALQDIIITGMVTKVEKQPKKKDGKVEAAYVLIDATGKEFNLPIPQAPKVKKGEVQPMAINLDAYVGKTVTVAAKGVEVEKKGVKTTTIKQILNVAEAPAAAPAGVAPVAPPAP